jgi:hypothetical protein
MEYFVLVSGSIAIFLKILSSPEMRLEQSQVIAQHAILLQASSNSSKLMQPC